MDPNYVVVYRANGKLMAESIRLFLESNGIKAISMQESAGTAYGFTIGPMGEVPVLVPEEQAQAATDLLEAMEKGEFIIPDGELDEFPGDEEDSDN
jgi:hypothetical protein